jgi:hypothetical protein
MPLGGNVAANYEKATYGQATSVAKMTGTQAAIGKVCRFSYTSSKSAQTLLKNGFSFLEKRFKTAIYVWFIVQRRNEPRGINKNDQKQGNCIPACKDRFNDFDTL